MSFQLTSESLKKLCKELKMFTSCPELNEILHLQCKGIIKLENLEAYSGVKTLYLESNAISIIEGLSHMVHLRSLFLGKNIIQKIENLENLTELQSLDLSDNDIRHLENLAGLPNLKTLNVSGNKLTTSNDIKELTSCSSLTSLDLSNNRIQDPAALELILGLPLTYLRLSGNPLVSNTRHYRKHILAHMPTLNYLDDSPCFEKERRLATAFQLGGLEAERREREVIKQEEADTRTRHHEAFDEMVKQARRDAELNPPPPPDPWRFHAHPPDGTQGQVGGATPEDPLQRNPLPMDVPLTPGVPNEADDHESSHQESQGEGPVREEGDGGAPAISQDACGLGAPGGSQLADAAGKVEQQVDAEPEVDPFSTYGDGPGPFEISFESSSGPQTVSGEAAPEADPGQPVGTESPSPSSLPILPGAMQRELMLRAMQQANRHEGFSNPVADEDTGGAQSRSRSRVFGSPWYSMLWEKAKQLGEIQEQDQDQGPSRTSVSLTPAATNELGGPEPQAQHLDPHSEGEGRAALGRDSLVRDDTDTSIADSAMNFDWESNEPPGGQTSSGPSPQVLQGEWAPREVHLGSSDQSLGEGQAWGHVREMPGGQDGDERDSDVDSDDLLLYGHRHHPPRSQSLHLPSGSLVVVQREDSASDRPREAWGEPLVAGRSNSRGLEDHDSAHTSPTAHLSPRLRLDQMPLSLSPTGVAGREVWVEATGQALGSQDGAHEVPRRDSAHDLIPGDGAGPLDLLREAREVLMRTPSGTQPVTQPDSYHYIAGALHDEQHLAQARAAVLGGGQHLSDPSCQSTQPVGSPLAEGVEDQPSSSSGSWLGRSQEPSSGGNEVNIRSKVPGTTPGSSLKLFELD